ncbi:MAG: hypothetical protein EXS51_01245 [Candidatus Taylorbacteria bacterium]|nr:hypothetical protein [Candidatus Taylorbacteria bacterium]
MSYHNATDTYLTEHGGPPTCGACNQEMFAMDDHGRFECECGQALETFRQVPPVPITIPQVDVTGMSDAEKVRIPPMNRLRGKPTAAEARLFEFLLQGPAGLDDPKYLEATKALERERREG